MIKNYRFVTKILYYLNTHYTYISMVRKNGTKNKNHIILIPIVGICIPFILSGVLIISKSFGSKS